MGIRFYCPNGCKLHVKAFQAGKRGICPHCGCSVDIPLQSTRVSSKRKPRTSTSENKPEAQEHLAEQAAGRPSRPRGLAGTEARETGPTGPAANLLEMPFPSPGPLPGPAHGDRELVKPVEPVSPTTPPPLKSGASPSSRRPDDPFAQSPHAIWYVCPPSGGQYGPAANEVMRTWLAEGRVPPESKVWRDGWSEWKTAAEVFPPTFFPSMLAADAFAQQAAHFRDDYATLATATPRGPAPVPSTLAQLFILLVVLVLAGGIVAAVYVWARFF